MVTSLLPDHIDKEQVEIWQQDETRIGQQGSLTRIWAKRGTRPRKVKQQQYLSTYLYGAACAATTQSFGLVLPMADTSAMNIFLQQLSTQIQAGKHVALVLDNAGWHTANKLLIPKNITLIPLPPYSPELNAMEQVWEWIKKHHLSNQCYENYEAIVEKVCHAWNDFSNNKKLVKSLCSRKWLFLP